MVQIETCEEKKYTQAKDGVAVGSTAMSHWKEHLFFEPRNIVSTYHLSVEKAHISPGQILIKIDFYFISLAFEQNWDGNHCDKGDE